jgi:hypothetical protein
MHTSWCGRVTQAHFGGSIRAPASGRGYENNATRAATDAGRRPNAPRYWAKHMNNPAPPVATRPGWVQSRDMCDEFQECW